MSLWTGPIGVLPSSGVGPAVSFVGGRFGVGDNPSIDTGPNSSFWNQFSIPFPSKSAVGNFFGFVMSYDATATLSSLSDNINGTWSTTPVRSATGVNTILSLFRFPKSASVDPNGSPLLVKATFNKNISIPPTWLVGWSGLSSSPEDGGNAAASVVATGSATVSAGSYTPTTNNDAHGGHLILTFAAVDALTAVSCPTLIAASSGTLQSADIGWINGSGQPKASSFLVQAFNGPVNPGFTLTANSSQDTWNVISEAFLISSGIGSPPTGARVSKYAFHLITAPPSSWINQVPLGTGDFPVLAGSNNCFASVKDSQGNNWTLSSGDGDPPNDTVGQVWYPGSSNTTITTPDPNFKVTGIISTNPPAQIHFAAYTMVGMSGAVGVSAFQVNPVPGSTVPHDPDITPIRSSSIVILAGPAGTGPVTGITVPSNAVFMSMGIGVNNNDGNTENSGDGWGHFGVLSSMAGSSISVTWLMGISSGGPQAHGVEFFAS